SGPVVLGVLEPSKPAAEHLLNGCEIVLAGDTLDLEPPVVASLGQSVLEHHHGTDFVRGPEIRYVVRLDAKGRSVQAEDVAELGQGAGPGAAVRGTPMLAAAERVP